MSFSFILSHFEKKRHFSPQKVLKSEAIWRADRIKHGILLFIL
jgi:hypothetical protein